MVPYFFYFWPIAHENVVWDTQKNRRFSKFFYFLTTKINSKAKICPKTDDFFFTSIRKKQIKFIQFIMQKNFKNSV